MQLVKKNADGTYVKHRTLPFSTLFIHTVNVRKEIVRFRDLAGNGSDASITIRVKNRNSASVSKKG